jgi:diguanylate cyclase (GGDEF)-like protein
MSSNEVIQQLKDEILTAISSRSSDEHLVMLFLNLDRFTLLNDCFGHTVGDQVIQHFQDKMSKLLMQYDAKFHRYAGNEFFIHALTANPNYHRQIGEHIIQQMTQMTIPLVNKDYGDIKAFSSLTCTVAAVAFSLDSLPFYPNPEFEHQSRTQLVNLLIGLCDSVLYARRCAGRGTLATLSLL